MPRRVPRVPRDVAALDLKGGLTEATVACHRAALGEFRSWLVASGCPSDLSVIAGAPLLMDALLTAFGRHSYAIGSPLYLFRYCLTGANQIDLNSRHRLPYAWNFLSKWEADSPSTHCTPIPLALLRAMIALAAAWGMIDWVAVSLITYWAPTRSGEPIDARRLDVTLPMGFFVGSLYSRLDTDHEAQESWAGPACATRRL